jgi:hypothetical protein
MQASLRAIKTYWPLAINALSENCLVGVQPQMANLPDIGVAGKI